MSHILVTGADGQLGNEFRKLSKNRPNDRFFFTDVADLDITNSQAVNEFMAGQEIQVVINCAAYTAVDKAENDEITATKINASAVKILAEACQKRQIGRAHV